MTRNDFIAHTFSALCVKAGQPVDMGGCFLQACKLADFLFYRIEADEGPVKATVDGFVDGFKRYASQVAETALEAVSAEAPKPTAEKLLDWLGAKQGALEYDPGRDAWRVRIRHQIFMGPTPLAALQDAYQFSA